MTGPLFWTLSLSVLLPAQKEAPAVKVMTTPSGIRFALMGEKKAKPAPTLFVFATAAEETLKHATYNHSGILLSEKGALCVALDWAAADARVGAVAAFAPVTDLLVLREFHGMEKHAATKALDLREHAGKLAGRPIWVCIGNNDERVGTDQLIGLTRKVVAASL